jgi:hypothetical protein
MAKGDEFGCFFGCHDAGELSYLKYGAFFRLIASILKGFGYFHREGDRASRSGAAMGYFFCSDIDHAGSTAVIQVSKGCHNLLFSA